MPNAIKYNVSAETLALKKGNFWIGTGDVGKGPTSSTGYYNGITPPSGGYTIYLNKASGGPSIYTVTTEAQLTGLTSTIAGQTLTTSGACLNWFATQTDKMIFNIDYPAIVTSGLTLNLDAGFTPSYPTTGTTWYDVSSGGNNGTLTNGPTYNSANGGSIVFDGTNDYVQWSTDSYVTPSLVSWWNLTSRSFEMWVNFSNLTFGYLFGVASTSDFETQSGYVIATSKFGIQLGGGNTTAGSTLSTNTWYQMVWVRNSSSSNTLFINGTQIGTISQAINDIQLGYDWQINMMRGGDFGNYKQGSVPIFRLYNRALSTTEVLQNYYAMLNSRMIVTNSLVLNLQAGNLNSYSGGGTVWKDVSGYGNDFTLANNPTFNTGNGGYLQFDGTDDYAYLAVNSSIRVGTSCSLEMVIKSDYSMRMGTGGGYWSYGFEGAGFSHTCGGNGNISPYFISAGFHHYVFTWNQAQNNHSMYRDGVLVYSFTPTCGFDAGSNGYFVLGGAYLGYNNSFQSYGTPHIAQLRLYGKILTTSEVEQNFNLMKPQYGL